METPTDAPTDAPAATPTAEPTEDPTAPSCEDSPTWYFRKAKRNCAWAAKNINKRCKKNGVDEGVRVRAYAACACACADYTP